MARLQQWGTALKHESPFRRPSSLRSKRFLFFRSRPNFLDELAWKRLLRRLSAISCLKPFVVRLSSKLLLLNGFIFPYFRTKFARICIQQLKFKASVLFKHKCIYLKGRCNRIHTTVIKRLKNQKYHCTLLCAIDLS